MRLPRKTALVLLTALALGAAGCERVSDRTGGDARQLVTRDYGATIVRNTQARSDGSALDALRASGLEVETEFGGGFVSAIGGIRADQAGPQDWFYYVNGVSPGRGADQLRLRPGDRVWWDYRRWGGLMDAWAVVGSWPEPFVNGYPSAPALVSADPPLADVLRRAGATVGDGDTPWRVRVGSDAELRSRDPAWQRAQADPAGAGMTVRFADSRILVLAPDGKTLRPVPGGRAAAVAVLTGASPESGGVLLAVVGLDGGAAEAAAQRIAQDPSVLAGRYAVVFDGSGAPILAAGRDTP